MPVPINHLGGHPAGAGGRDQTRSIWKTSQPVQHVGAEVLAEHVRPLAEPPEHLLRPGVLQVQGDRPLPAVSGLEEEREVAPRALDRAPALAGGGLDLDHVGTVILAMCPAWET